MTLPEQITSVKRFRESIFKEKGSEFIAQVFPAENTEECDVALSAVKKKYFNATHHCYAYKLLNNVNKFSDDGEPSGTAGKRILNAIEHFDLVNLLVVVIRYFGGTKLGVGPLGKAYYTSAFNLLDKSEKISKSLLQKIRIVTSPTFISSIYRITSNFDGKVENTSFGEELICEIVIPARNMDLLKNDIKELTSGNFQLKTASKPFYL
ncbi:MAG TPA: YigZ family protein [Ignavibacteriaceae bacterium]|nr:YigZ family protein [Ignavibacteriaceae bacterium]